MTITMAGSALALGTVLHPMVFLFALFGWLYHNGGYGHNSVEDFISGHDMDDPHKSHHPLQRGAVDPRRGRTATLLLILLTFIFGLLLSGMAFLPVAILVLMTLMGFVYNRYNKRMSLKFVPIAIAHSLLFTFAYISSGGSLDLTSSFPFTDSWVGAAVVLSTLYLILQVAYQIMVEGDLKDIDMEEASLLKRLGARVKDDRFSAPWTARVVSVKIKLISLFLLFMVHYLVKGGPLDFGILCLFAAFMLLLENSLMRGRTWDHSKTVRNMATMEVVSTFALVVAVSPGAGGTSHALLIMAVNAVYFIIMNRLLWGTFIRPRV